MSKLEKSLIFFILATFAVFSSAAWADDQFDDLRPATNPGVDADATGEPKAGAPIADFSVAQQLPDARDEFYEYRIGPLDLLEVEVFGVAELGRTSRVDTAGNVSLPLIGAVKVAGLTAREAESAIEEALKKEYMRDPHVTVFIAEYESQKITVEGWVKSPGVFPLKGKTSFLQAIANAKGMDKFADFSEVAVFRTDKEGKTTGYILSYTKVRAGEQIDPLLQDGDIIVVNRSGSKTTWAFVTGSLRSFVGWVLLF